MTPLAQIDLEHAQGVVQHAQEVVEHVAKEPLEWWLAFLTLGSLICVYFVVKRMLAAQHESNKALLDMVKEKDNQLNITREKMISILEDRWKNR